MLYRHHLIQSSGEGPAVAAGEPAGVGEYPASYAPAPSEELLDVPEGNGRMLSSDERDDSEMYFDTDAYYFDEVWNLTHA